MNIVLSRVVIIVLIVLHAAVCSVLIGSFQNTIHEVQGTVYVDDSTTIRIENFHYDGLGPGEFGHPENLIVKQDSTATLDMYSCLHLW